MKRAGFSIKAGLVFNNVAIMSASLEAATEAEPVPAAAGDLPNNGLPIAAAAAAACFNMLTVSESVALGVLEVLYKEEKYSKLSCK